MANLGYKISDAAIGNILREHGIDPSPERKKQTTWKAFLEAHRDVLAAIDYDDRGLDKCGPLHKITGERLSPLHRFLCGYIKKRQKQGAFRTCDPKLAAYAIVSMPGYYGLSKILFGVDDLTLTEDQMAAGFTQLILDGLHASGLSSRKKDISKVKTNRQRT